ncbi:Zinc finger C2H2-type [Babesia duncani]|uniref:Zinc finger C2H2-type n=1 Tax=Babesia duncani TaxID=323732 RepID=A0AAD9PHR9_9APIC|nr:Zinc finger C2H2-type [Babesia duncani]
MSDYQNVLDTSTNASTATSNNPCTSRNYPAPIGLKDVKILEPSSKYRNITIGIEEARCMLLLWASSITCGNAVNRSLLNRLLQDCSKSKCKVDFISKSVLKSHAGLHDADNFFVMEAMDSVLVLENIMEHLTCCGKMTFVLMIDKEKCCIGIYYNLRGTLEDILVLEIRILKAPNSQWVRMAAFKTLDDMHQYLSQSKTLQPCANVYCYIFNIAAPPQNWNIASPISTSDLKKGIVAVSQSHYTEFDPLNDSNGLY